MFRLILPVFLLFSLITQLQGKEKVSFFTSDSVKVSADLYLKGQNLPFILLFHQAEGSKGEYTDIAPRLLKLNYNCLVVDLRVGSKINFVRNETAELAKVQNKKFSLFDANKDIVAAINFVQKYNTKDLILIGSSFSASLCLMYAAERDGIKSVIAFSPGEYFRPDIVVKDYIQDLDIPVFISATKLEIDYVKQMTANLHQEDIRFYFPSKINGEHGAKMLWDSSESSDECWFELLLFFKKIRY